MISNVSEFEQLTALLRKTNEASLRIKGLLSSDDNITEDGVVNLLLDATPESSEEPESPRESPHVVLLGSIVERIGDLLEKMPMAGGDRPAELQVGLQRLSELLSSLNSVLGSKSVTTTSHGMRAFGRDLCTAFASHLLESQLVLAEHQES